MQMVRLYLFQNYIKEEKSGLIRQCDEREKVYEEICICVWKNLLLKSVPEKYFCLQNHQNFIVRQIFKNFFYLPVDKKSFL